MQRKSTKTKTISLLSLNLLLAASLTAAPVVFWSADKVVPGDVTLLYGGGLSNATSVLLRSLDENGTEVSAPAIQPCNNSVKFVLPAALKPGVFSVQVVAGGERSAARLINQPEIWFLQTSYAEICALMKKASETYLKGILGYTTDEVVSSDFIHCQLSSIFDKKTGIGLNSKFFKLVSWYDNEWGYSCRTVQLLQKVGASLK